MFKTRIKKIDNLIAHRRSSGARRSRIKPQQESESAKKLMVEPRCDRTLPRYRVIAITAAIEPAQEKLSLYIALTS